MSPSAEGFCFFHFRNVYLLVMDCLSFKQLLQFGVDELKVPGYQHYLGRLILHSAVKTCSHETRGNVMMLAYACVEVWKHCS